MLARIVPLLAIAVSISLQARAIDLEPVSPDRPWLIFRAPEPPAGDTLAYADQIKQTWNALPDTLRPLAALEIAGPRMGAPGWSERFRDVVNEMQFANIPTVAWITGGPATPMPAEEVRKVFDQFATVRGVRVSGLTFGEYPSFAPADPAPQAAWLASIIDLAAQYGRRVILELDGLEWARLTANPRNKIVYDAMRAHPAVVVPMNSQRGQHSVAATSSVMGLWLEGAAAQWGLACDSSWFADAGFIEPGKFGAKPDAVMPPALYRAMLLNGVMTGATVYRFARAEDLWAGPRKQYWAEAIEPTLREVVEKGYIARKDLVKEKVHVAYRLNAAPAPADIESDLADLDPIYHEGRMIQGAYGLEVPGQIRELILNTGRFYWIPVFSPYATDETLGAFKEVVLPGALLNAAAWRERLEGQYKPDGDGRAFISKIGRGIFVMHTHENLYEAQPYALAAVPAAVRGMTARRGPQGTEITWPSREGDVSYRVYKRVLPATRWEKVSPDLDAHVFTDQAPPDASQTVAYGVTALTSETESLQGTVNYGDYLIVNAVESRIVEQAVLEPSTNATTSVPPPPKADSRPATQSWWPEIENLTADQLAAAQSIVAQIDSFETAYRKGDAKAAALIYSPSYADANGWGADYVRAAYGLFFKLFYPGPVLHQIRAWDFSALATDGRVSVRLYFRLTGQRRAYESNGTPGPEVALPPSPNGEVDLVFQKTGEQWQVMKTTPPLPQLEDFFASVPGVQPVPPSPSAATPIAPPAAPPAPAAKNTKPL